MKATIVDVARAANVSKATVSRVINNKTNVSEEVKKRVLAAIEELQFRPSAVARNLSNSMTNMIGLIMPDITNPFFPVLARGIEDAAHTMGYTLFLSNTDNDPDVELEYVRKMAEQQVAGIILISSSFTGKRASELMAFNIPIVLCDRSGSETPFDTVTIDHYKAAYEAVAYLIGKGHRNICHLSGPVSAETADFRIKGYVDAMKDANLTPVVSYGMFSYESGYQQMNEVLEKGTGDIPTAVFGGNDLIALGAIHAIEKTGRSVPGDIAVIGFDDILFAQMSKPLLSTVNIPAYQLGVTAMKLMDDRIKGVRVKKKSIVLDHKLIIRESCGREE